MDTWNQLHNSFKYIKIRLLVELVSVYKIYKTIE